MVTICCTWFKSKHALSAHTLLKHYLYCSRLSEGNRWVLVLALLNLQVLIPGRQSTLQSPVVKLHTTSFNIHKSYVLPIQCIYVFCVDSRRNSDYFPTQHLLISFCNRDGVCLLRGTDWVFIYNSGYVFCVDLRTNSDYFPVQHQLTGFCNRDGECLLRGNDWLFKYNSV